MEWKGLFKDNILRGGQEYLNSNSVHNVSVSEDEIKGDVSGIDNFHVSIKISGGAVDTVNCTCPLAQTGAKCKHMAAVLFAWEQSTPVAIEPVAVSEPVEEIETAPINENVERDPVIAVFCGECLPFRILFPLRIQRWRLPLNGRREVFQ